MGSGQLVWPSYAQRQPDAPHWRNTWLSQRTGRSSPPKTKPLSPASGRGSSTSSIPPSPAAWEGSSTTISQASARGASTLPTSPLRPFSCTDAGIEWCPQRTASGSHAVASGTLISALAFVLFPEAVHLGGLWPAGLGLIAGGLTFVVIDTALDSWVARSAGDPHEVPALPPEAAEEISGAEAEQTERMQEAAATRQAGSAAVG